MRRIVIVLFAALSLAAAPPPGTIQVHAKDIVWKDAPPTMPPGTKIAVLEGDMHAAGIFTLRLKVPAGSRLGPHCHPRPERVTVLSGEVRVGFGDKIDVKGTTLFRAGDFYVNPPESHHYVVFTATTIVQITGEGPWVTNPADSPSCTKTKP